MENRPSEKDVLSRRNVLKVAAVVAGGAAAAGVIKHHRDSGHQPESSDDETNQEPQADATPPTPRRPESDSYADWKEVEVDHETSEFLTDNYGLAMDGRYFPSNTETGEFMDKVTQVAGALNPDNPNLANQLAAIMCYETGSEFKTDLENHSTGGVGIFQLTPDNLKAVGVSPEEVLQMDPTAQLDVLYKFLSQKQDALVKKSGEKFYELSDLYCAKLQPGYVGEPLDSVIYPEGLDKYELYKGLDYNSDGEITKAEIEQTITDYAVDRGEYEEYLTNSKSPRVEALDRKDYSDEVEHTESDEETARYLVEKVYGESMNEREFPDKQSKIDFMVRVTRIAKRLRPDEDPASSALANQIAAVMNFESGISSKIRNRWSKATGLIQFMPDTARSMGTNISRLAHMEPVDQLFFVEGFLKDRQNQASAPFKDISDVYMAVLYPVAIGEPSDYVLFEEGSTAYKQNKGLDLDGDGKITKLEATMAVIEKAAKDPYAAQGLPNQ